jgi:hypothetical protein
LMRRSWLPRADMMGVAVGRRSISVEGFGTHIT